MNNVISEISTSPNWLIDLCKNKKGDSLSVSEEPRGQFLGMGRRNTDMASVAGFLRNKGANEQQIHTALSGLNKNISNPLEATELKNITQSISRYDVAPDGFTHDSFARLLVSKFAGHYLYCVGRGYYHFDGKRWVSDTKELHTLNIARGLSDDINADILRLKGSIDDESYSKLKKSVSKIKSTDFMTKSIKLAASDPLIRVEIGDFDRNAHLINLNNGTYDLIKGVLNPFNPLDRITHFLDVAYDANAKCPVFQKVLSDALDTDQADFLIRIIGYALVGNAREQRFFIFHGTGKNGKSTIINAVSDVLSQLVLTIQPETLTGKLDGQIRNDLARLPGKRILLTSETKAGNIIDAPLIKQITGADTLTARFLHQEFFEFKPRCVPFIITNHLPVIDGSDFAMARRVLLIKFTRKIVTVDPDLEVKLSAEKSGILNMFLAGVKSYRKVGLSVPLVVSVDTDSYITRSNLMEGFFQDRLILGTGTISASSLYRTYQSWCFENGFKPMSTNTFKDAFERHTGLDQRRDKDGRCWEGLELKP